MTDLEKAIKGLKCCAATIRGCAACPTECPYYGKCLGGGNGVFFDLMKDALAMLKAQEPVEPMKRIEETEWTVCGCCKSHIISKWSFCPYCGKAVKWNEPPKEES